jgi:hypothetical protein
LCDKDQFAKFCDGRITFEQLRSRVAERRLKVKYTVLDDVRDRLDPSFMGENLKKFKPQILAVYGKNPSVTDL